MSSAYSFSSKEKPKQRRSKAGEHGGDPLAATKAAAWAWLEHESEQPDVTVYWRTRMAPKPPRPRPSRYKKEAMERTSNKGTCTKSLMDAYEIKMITKKIENSVASSSWAERDCEDKGKERNKARGRVLRKKHRVVCGGSDDIIDAIRLSRVVR